jgi:hypothetical protein
MTTFMVGGSLISNKTPLACQKDFFKVLPTNNFTLFYYFPSAFHVGFFLSHNTTYKIHSMLRGIYLVRAASFF